MGKLYNRLASTAMMGGMAFFLTGEPRNTQSTAHEDPTSGPLQEGVDLNHYANSLYRMDKDGKPAFLSWWPEGTPPEQRVLRVNIATKLPEYMKGNKLPYLLDDTSRLLLNTTNTLEQSFAPIDERTEKIVREYAEDFKKTYGITLQIGKDIENPHITVCASGLQLKSSQNEKYLGFASFPPGATDSSYAAPQGWVLLNLPLANLLKLGDDDIYSLIAHEFGHAALGLRHATDLENANHNLSCFTIMGHGQRNFLNHSGTLKVGPMDHLIAERLGHTPPDDTAPGGLYDLQSITDKTDGKNPNHKDGPKAALTIRAPGNITLRGTTNDDYLDLRPRYSGAANAGDEDAIQPFTIAKGTLQTVSTRGGGDVIIAPPSTEALFSTGSSTNAFLFMYPNIGHPTLNCKGQDTLLLFQDVIRDQKCHASFEGNDVVLHFGEGNHESTITLKGQLLPGRGINKIMFGNRHKVTLGELDVDRHNPEHFWSNEFPEFIRNVRHTTGFSADQVRWMKRLEVTGAGRNTNLILTYTDFDADEPTDKTIHLRMGNKDRLIVHKEEGYDGSKLLVSSLPKNGNWTQEIIRYVESVNDTLNKRTAVKEGTESANLSLNDLHAEHTRIGQRGNDILVTTFTDEGTNEGSLLLKGQYIGRGISKLNIVDDEGNICHSLDVSLCRTPAQWDKALASAKVNTFNLYNAPPPPVTVPQTPPMPDHIKDDSLSPKNQEPQLEPLAPAKLGKMTTRGGWRSNLTPADRESPTNHTR